MKILHFQDEAAAAASYLGDLKKVKMAKIETFNYFRSTTEKWRQKELKRLERRLNKKKKKRSNKN